MLSVKKTVSGIFLIFTLWLTSCGLPPGPNTAPGFVTISSPTLLLSDKTLNSINPQIAVDSSNRIFVVWQDNNNISYTYSTNGGTSFLQPPISVIGGGGGSLPRITTDGNGNAYIIWYYAQNILLNYATTNGFQNTMQISTATVPFSQSSIAPPADMTYDSISNNLFIAWSQCTNCLTSLYDINYTTVSLSSLPLSTSPPARVSDGAGFASYPKITLSGGIPYILYSSTSPSSHLFLAKVPPASTINTINVNNPSVALNASLGVDVNGNSYIAWNPSSQLGSDVFFNTLLANSAQFNTSSINLTNNANSYGPTIALDSSQYVYVAFFSRTAANTSAYDVFLERSSDGGKSFSGAMNISNTSGDSVSYAPGMAIVGKTAYIVWDDNSFSANHQILFQKVTLN